MKRLVEFPVESGESVWIEIEELDTEDRLTKGVSPTELTTRATITLEEALSKVKPAAAAIIRKLRSLSDPPEEVTVEFGLKMNAEVGAVVAAAGVEANYRITLTWKVGHGE